MKRFAPLFVGIALAAAAIYFWLHGRQVEPVRWLGYVEGESLYIAAPVSGTLAARAVERGATVKAGDLLFTLDPVTSDAEIARLRANVAAARANLADLRKNRQRQPELAVARAAQDAARAEIAQAKKDYDRISALAAKGYATRARLEAARANLSVAEASLAQARAQEQSGQLSAGRQDQVQAAAAAVASAEAAVTAQLQRRRDISPVAPASGSIEQTYYNAGEWVNANAPVLSLLPADKRKIRFFVPENRLAQIRIGADVQFSCDSCTGLRQARITFIAPRAEFTPPVIYSERARSKLVFLVEAKLPTADHPLPVGLPVDVLPPPEQP